MALYRLDGIDPEIAADAWVAPTAVLVGRVRLLPGASVWWNAVLRGDNEWIELGEGANLQDGVVCHTDPGAPLTVHARVTVGHGAVLHGCTLGEGSLVGMGAIVLNHAVVGRNALLAAGALVPQGKTIPEGVLAVGSPARVVRDLKPDEIARMANGAERYVHNARRYREGCQGL
jgi:carbonic anhydrase/acetyltransferase-like protein (isoleucine patch superfamily)